MQFGLVHISAGDLLRAEIEEGTEDGKKAKGYMDKGQLVPNEVVVQLVKNRLAKPDAAQQGWLLDGYPRSAEQADAIKEADINPDVFILINVSFDASMPNVTDPGACNLWAVVQVCIAAKRVAEFFAGASTCPTCSRVSCMVPLVTAENY